MEKESSSSDGEQISPKLLRVLKKQGEVVSSTSSLSAMIEKVVEKAVHSQIQQVLPQAQLPISSPCKAKKKSVKRTRVPSSEEESEEDLPNSRRSPPGLPRWAMTPSPIRPFLIRRKGNFLKMRDRIFHQFPKSIASVP